MSTKSLNSGAVVLAASFAVTVLTWDQDPLRGGLSDDFTSPWCLAGSLESWEGRPCVVPLRPGSADGTAVPRQHKQRRL
ncbi:MAG: hypothetical protein JO328_16000 [Hyphomicrobiales bacterium]|nr:hypothetical protein [Hyphomicrobiales bacterium]MBV8826906.1 hypothetical protein [Hyphomicrobiales bacterium]MBV9429267.1 hypothetical protein [Bradyrhizobiaceae bacterium]